MTDFSYVQGFSFLRDVVDSDAIAGSDKIDSNLLYLITKSIDLDLIANKLLLPENLDAISKCLSVISETISIINHARSRVVAPNNGLSEQYAILLNAYVCGLYEMYKSYIAFLSSAAENPVNSCNYREISKILSAYSRLCDLTQNTKYVELHRFVSVLTALSIEFSGVETKMSECAVFSVIEKSTLKDAVKNIFLNRENLTFNLQKKANEEFAKPVSIIGLKFDIESATLNIYGFDTSGGVLSSFYTDYGLLFNPYKNCFYIPIKSIAIDYNESAPVGAVSAIPTPLLLMINLIVSCFDYIYVFDHDLFLKNEPLSRKDLINAAHECGDSNLLVSAIKPS